MTLCTKDDHLFSFLADVGQEGGDGPAQGPRSTDFCQSTDAKLASSQACSCLPGRFQQCWICMRISRYIRYQKCIYRLQGHSHIPAVHNFELSTDKIGEYKYPLR